MDASLVASVTGAVVGFLTAYFRKAAESGAGELGKQAGSAVWQKAKSLFDLVRGNLGQSQEAQAKLDDLVTSPDDPAKAEAVRTEVELLLSRDAALLKLFREQLIQLDEAGADGVFQTNIHGQIKNFTQIGTMYGDLNIS
jgi:hypothetical protein